MTTLIEPSVAVLRAVFDLPGYAHLRVRTRKSSPFGKRVVTLVQYGCSYDDEGTPYLVGMTDDGECLDFRLLNDIKSITIC